MEPDVLRLILALALTTFGSLHLCARYFVVRDVALPGLSLLEVRGEAVAALRHSLGQLKLATLTMGGPGAAQLAAVPVAHHHLMALDSRLSDLELAISRQHGHWQSSVSARVANSASDRSAPPLVAAVSAPNRECSAVRATGLLDQLQADFRQYESMTPGQRTAYPDYCGTLKHSCATILSVDGELFVKHFFAGYQSRHRATLHAIYRAALRLGPFPDSQIVIEFTDGNLWQVELPLLVITRPTGTRNGILYPDFTFFSWPEAVCGTERSHSHSVLMREFEMQASKLERDPEQVFASKHDKLFWRGAPVGNNYRQTALANVAGDSQHIDMQFMTWKAVSTGGNNTAPGCVGLLDHCRNRYLAFLQGNSYSSRLKYQLLCGSTVLAARQGWEEFWTRQLVPNKHFVEVAADWSDAKARLADLRSNQRKALSIAKRGQRLALDLLNDFAVDCYWAEIFSSAARFLPKPPRRAKLPSFVRPIQDVLLFHNDDAITPDGIRSAVQPVR
mmetsp:Transcript_24092/g.58578  ORF Transcript_24092/g.58578 Transcript_24092/m.58578 type:complete len:504 (+) Transcript_24092:24-1535(+)